MKIEYVAEGPPEAPLVRIYGDDPASAAYLAEAFDQLAGGATEMLSVHELPGFEPVGEIRLLARVGEEDRGLKPSRVPGLFDMMLTASGWDELAGALDPFCEPAQGDTRSHWLAESGEVKLIITTSETGEW